MTSALRTKYGVIQYWT